MREPTSDGGTKPPPKSSLPISIPDIIVRARKTPTDPARGVDVDQRKERNRVQAAPPRPGAEPALT